MFNGHLDTYPVGDPELWTTDPAGERRGDRLYGRGAADMKGGIAASISALATLAAHRHAWPGEAVLTLAGDEESMGPLGTRWLLDHIPHTSGDAVLIPDAGSPRVLRFGEKGLSLDRGRGHRPRCPRRPRSPRRKTPSTASSPPSPVSSASATSPSTPPPPSSPPSTAPAPSPNPLAGAGEAAVLAQLTINIGRIEGGTSTNLVPTHARAGIDIRLPVGLPTAHAVQALTEALDLPGITHRILRRFEPNHTDPATPLVRIAAAAAREVLGAEIAVNMRIGGSDARWFRMADMPTIVYGPTPHGMGGPDEWVDLPELDQVARVLALTAFDLLRQP